METFKAVIKCASCGHTNDALTALIGEEGPREGDFTICLYCAGILRLKDGEWIAATAEELTDFYERQPDAFKVLQMAHEIIMQRISPFSVEIGEIEWSDGHGNEGEA